LGFFCPFKICHPIVGRNIFHESSAVEDESYNREDVVFSLISNGEKKRESKKPVNLLTLAIEEKGQS